MCLAVPMRVISIEDNVGRVDASGAELQVSFELVDGVKLGDYVLVHAGFAIARLSEEDANETLAILARL
jgi:hydrogenase expression/formation protein HypC